MSRAPDWWRRPRVVSVVIDNDEWMLAHCERLADLVGEGGDDAVLCRSYEEIPEGAVAFYLSCHRVAPRDVLARNRRNLVVHASDLPEGRGWSPLTWQILEGRGRIAVCLLEAAAEVDAGPVIYKEHLAFAGHELIDEMRGALAELSLALCRRFLSEPLPPEGALQRGAATYWPRRHPEDSALDPDKTIAEQFERLRVADNERYPAYFEWRGHTYRLRIDKLPPGSGSGEGRGPTRVRSEGEEEK
jgi:methionyl-tRNA formyltransferase